MIKNIILTILVISLLPFAVQAEDVSEFESDDYLNFSREVKVGDNDPFEGMNRTFRDFNAVVDSLILDPVASAYTGVVPKFARNGVHNFLENINAPVIFVNSILQGDPQNVFVTFWRFVFNSTLGVGGLFDIATELGMPERNHEDFGQTLGVWGVGHGAYLELPFFGPSSLRDAPGKVVDILMNPFSYILTAPQSIAIAVTRTVDTRARLDKYIDQVNNTSIDPYATFRSLYLQHRKGLVNNFETK